MQIFVRAEGNHVLEVENGIVSADMVAAAAGVPVDMAMLSMGGRPVEGEFAVDDLCTIDVAVRLLGGKVHGSLARAGKVKGQTPKVEAGEKQKKLTGRAKRRMQYNRRFVNVVSTGAKKKGPNSNS